MEKVQKSKTLIVKVSVQTEVKREGVVRGKQGRFQVAVRAPREQNQANLRVRELMAEYLKVPLAAVRITGGHHRLSKTLEVKGNTYELQR